MDEDEKTKNPKLLEKYKKDPSKKLIFQHYDSERKEEYFTYQDWVKELPDLQRVKTTHFTVYDDGRVWQYSHVSKNQKFLCVGGPLGGAKSTEEGAPEYAVFNCAVSGDRNKNVARVVLVYRQLCQADQKSGRK